MPLSDFDPGEMTARLILEAPVETADGQGGVVTTYLPVASLWARIVPVRLEVFERAGGDVATITHNVWIRRRDDVVAGMRLRKGGRLFAVVAFHDPDDSGRYGLCRCEEAGR